MTADDERTAREAGTERLRVALRKAGAARDRFRQWRRSRPFWGGLLIVTSGLEIFGSTQLSLGDIQVSIGLEGLQSIVIPVILVMAGILIWAMPVHRVFYAVIALVVALYSLIGVNLGGFLVGMLLGIVGGSLAIAWSPREPEREPSPDDGTLTDDEPTSELGDGPWAHLQPQDTQVTQNDPIVPGMRNDRGASSARLAVTGAVAGALIVAAIAPASATSSLVSQTTGEDCEPDPAPTESPSPMPDPTATSDPDLIEDLLSTLTDVLEPAGDAAEPAGDECEPVADPTEGPTTDPTGDPTSDPTSDPTGAPTPDPTGEQTPDSDEASEQATENEQSDETDELGLPEGFELPEDAVLTTPQTLDNENVPFVAASPGRLTGSSITMTGLVYEGNVDLPTDDGLLTVMKFTMNTSVVADFSLAVDAMGQTLLTTTDELTISGDVTFYTDRFVGRMLGFKWTFIPETPPPFTLPYMVFTDPEIRLVAVEADVLTAKPMNQRQIS